jgi:poly(A) polymerase
MNELLPLLRQAADELSLRACMVGGCVRDELLGRSCHDVDVVVEGPTDGALRLAVRFAELASAPPPALFPRFGTAHVVVSADEFEFVSARAESYSPDSRKPDVRPATLAEDVRRRDFTVNALLMRFDGEVVDLTSGLRDLEARVLRTPVDPYQTFNDDPLRMLRAVRFAAQLDFELAPGLLEAMRAMRERARPPQLSAERVRDELVKMLLSPAPRRALELLDAAGLLEVVLPELAACKGVEQNEHHLYPVYEHTLAVVTGLPADLTLRLAALFHDVGKPATADGAGHFYGHQDVSADMARAAMRRLRFSDRQADDVVKLVALHMHPMRYRSDWGNGAVRRLVAAAGPLLESLMVLARADAGASAHPDREQHDELERRLAAVQVEEPERLAPLPVDGHDVMRECDLPPGPRVGKMLKQLREYVLDGRVPADREVLLTLLGMWAHSFPDYLPTDEPVPGFMR